MIKTKWKPGGYFVDRSGTREAMIHGIKDVLYPPTTTAFQEVAIVETYCCGRCLILEGRMNVSLKDEHEYHEPLVHAAMLSHRNPERILIIGGGDGGSLREVMRYKNPNLRCTLVDIDAIVIKQSQIHLPEVSAGAFDDPRARIIIADALKHLTTYDEVYDIIIIDLSEPMKDGPAHPLYTKQFYELVRSRLAPDGYVTIQAGSLAFHDLACTASVRKTLRAAGFTSALPLRITPHSFGAVWALMLAFQAEARHPLDYPPTWIDDQINERLAGPLHYYHGDIHHGQFALGNDIFQGLGIKSDAHGESCEGEGRVIQEGQPFYVT